MDSFLISKDNVLTLFSENGKEIMKIINNGTDDENFNIRIRTKNDVSIKPVISNSFDLIIEKGECNE